MITERIFHWAEQARERTAMVHDDQVWSYGAFARAIAEARARFNGQGLAGEGFVVLALDNLADFWITSLALRSLGLTTMTVGGAGDLARLGLPAVRCVITDATDHWTDFERQCADLGLTLCRLSAAGSEALGLEPGRPTVPGGHILQTSGTTGVYKKVLIDPSFEDEFLRLRQETIGIGRESVVNIFNLSPTYGVGYKVPACTWAAGGCVVMRQSGQTHLTLRHPGLTHASLTPRMLAEVLAAPEGAYPRSDTMRLSIVSGTVTQVQIDQARARITPNLYNRLSAGETSIFGYTPLDGPDDHRWHRLVPGRTVEIVDDLDRPVPTGQLGRVRVSTEGGPNDYLFDEAATRAFFKDGFFYPGDLGLMRADGRMALQGRVTEVMNLNGHKILPAPIEDRLREAFGVSGVCLFSMQDDHGEEQIHVVIEAAAPVAAERLVAALSREFVGFPRALVHYLPALPRTDNGKIRRDAVRAQATGLPGLGERGENR